MWFEILWGLVVFRLLRRFFYDDDILEIETTDSDSKFLVASRIEKLYGGKVYLGLRIPDADTGSRQNIHMVLVTKGEAVVIAVKNFSGFVGIDADGSWVCTSKSKYKTERHPDPVVETKRTIHSISFPSEVISFDEWIQLKPEPKSMFSGWFKDAFRGEKKMYDAVHQKLHFVLSTAPVWDRLELKNNKNLLGEFMEFKGKQEDIQALRNIKRSKVSWLIIQKSAMFGLGRSKLQVLYSPRDYRNEGASVSEWKEVTVRHSTEVLFQPQNSNKVQKFKLSSIISLSLSA